MPPVYELASIPSFFTEERERTVMVPDVTLMPRSRGTGAGEADLIEPTEAGPYYATTSASRAGGVGADRTWISRCALLMAAVNGPVAIGLVLGSSPRRAGAWERLGVTTDLGIHGFTTRAWSDSAKQDVEIV